MWLCVFVYMCVCVCVWMGGGGGIRREGGMWTRVNSDRVTQTAIMYGWVGGGLGGKRGMFHNPDYTLHIFFTDITYFFTQLIVPQGSTYFLHSLLFHTGGHLHLVHSVQEDVPRLLLRLTAGPCTVGRRISRTPEPDPQCGLQQLQWHAPHSAQL